MRVNDDGGEGVVSDYVLNDDHNEDDIENKENNNDHDDDDDDENQVECHNDRGGDHNGHDDNC